MPTYTSSWFSVSDGDSTSHDPQSLVNTSSPITITSAQIRWEGVQTSGTSTSTDYSTNTNTISLTTDESTDTNNVGVQDGYTGNVEFPQVPSGSEFVSHSLKINIDTTQLSTGDSDAYVTYDTTGDTRVIDEPVSPGIDKVVYDNTTSTHYDTSVGDDATRELSIDDHPNGSVVGSIEAQTTYKKVDYTDTNDAFIDDGDNNIIGIPQVPPGYEFVSHSLQIDVDTTGISDGGSDTYYTYDTIDGSQISDDAVSPGKDITLYTDTTSTHYDESAGDDYTRSFEITANSDGLATANIELQTTYKKTKCESYPSVPTGYTFDRHYWREEKNESYIDSGYIYTNSVGDSRCIELFDGSNTRGLELNTRGSDTTTSDETYNTHDPSVSGDVSGSYTGTLNDGEQSAWQTLTGLTASSNTFNHSIQESNKAKYQFEFTWENLIPSPVHGTVGFYVNGEWKECSVADPTNTKLDYDHVLVYNGSQNAWGALDVVDPSDELAITSQQFYDSDAGWVAPRQYGTTQ